MHENDQCKTNTQLCICKLPEVCGTFHMVFVSLANSVQFSDCDMIIYVISKSWKSQVSKPPAVNILCDVWPKKGICWQHSVAAPSVRCMSLSWHKVLSTHIYKALFNLPIIRYRMITQSKLPPFSFSPSIVNPHVISGLQLALTITSETMLLAFRRYAVGLQFLCRDGADSCFIFLCNACVLGRFFFFFNIFC